MPIAIAIDGKSPTLSKNLATEISTSFGTFSHSNSTGSSSCCCCCFGGVVAGDVVVSLVVGSGSSSVDDMFGVLSFFLVQFARRLSTQ